MKSLADYWKTKFVELQKLTNEEKKKSDTKWHSEKKELKDKIFEYSVRINELQDKISELEKTLAVLEKVISQIEPDKEAIAESYRKKIEIIKNEAVENIHLIEQQNYNNELVLISEFERFLKKDAGYVHGLVSVLDEICKEKKSKKIIKNLIEHSQQISQQADELSWFSRQIKKEEERANIPNVLEEVVSEIKELSSAKNIKISRDIVTEIPEINISDRHLKTVFTEIIKNSFDAMPHGGQLTIKTERDGGVIEFSDTGRGIPSHLLEKINKPFFSTKKKIGFGLGLTRVRKILDVYGYRLTIFSEEDKGTTVKITFNV